MTVQHYWADKETGDKLSNLDPSKIQIDFTNDGWTEDKSAETTERNVFYYNSILKKGQTSSDLCWRQLLMQYRHTMQRTQLRVRGVLM